MKLQIKNLTSSEMLPRSGALTPGAPAGFPSHRSVLRALCDGLSEPLNSCGDARRVRGSGRAPGGGGGAGDTAALPSPVVQLRILAGSAVGRAGSAAAAPLPFSAG